MIILGVILLIVGFVASIPILWTIGIIVLVIGLVLLPSAGRPGRRRPQALLLNPHTIGTPPSNRPPKHAPPGAAPAHA